MQPSDQFKFPADSIESSRRAAEFASSMDKLQQTDGSEKVAEKTDDTQQTREERVERVRQSLGEHLWVKTEVLPTTPEQPLFEEYRNNLSGIADTLESYRNQETNR